MKSTIRNAFVATLLSLAACTASAADETVVVLEINGGIGVATADYLASGIRHAETLAGIMVLSGYELLPPADAEGSEIAAGTASASAPDEDAPIVIEGHTYESWQQVPQSFTTPVDSSTGGQRKQFILFDF